MHQQQLDNAATTTQQMQCNYACGTNRATTPFANALIWLDRLQPPSLDNAYAMTQLKMQQQQQHHLNILNQPQKIYTSLCDSTNTHL